MHYITRRWDAELTDDSFSRKREEEVFKKRVEAEAKKELPVQVASFFHFISGKLDHDLSNSSNNTVGGSIMVSTSPKLCTGPELHLVQNLHRKTCPGTNTDWLFYAFETTTSIPTPTASSPSTTSSVGD